MTPLALYFAVAVVTLTATACWALLAQKRAVYLTSGLSFVGYAWLSLVGADVAMITTSGDRVWLRETLASVQWVALALAIVSLLVFVLRLLGSYPSPDENAADEEQTTDRTTRSTR